MEDLLEDEETKAARQARRRLGKALGIGGVGLLFGPALALLFLPDPPETALVATMAVGTALLFVAFLAVR